MKFPRRHNETRSHATVGMNAEHLQILATIRVPAQTRVAMLAINIRLDRTTIPNAHIRHSRPNRDHFNTQFVPWNPRIAIERLLAEITAQVRAANADPLHTHGRFARSGCAWLRNVDMAKLLRLLQLNCF